MGKSCQLSEVDRQKLQQWTAAHGTPQQVALRCRIVLAAAAGESDVAIAKRLSVNRNTVILWRKRFGDEGLDGLWDIAPGRGRKPTYPIDKIAAIVDATLETKPKGMTHWSCRTMAKAQGVSKATVNRIWQSHNLKPHCTDFQIVARPKVFGEDDRRGRTLFESAAKRPGLVLGRKEPDSSLGSDPAGVATEKRPLRNYDPRLRAARHDDALCRSEHLHGKVVGQCHARHRHQEWLNFLRQLDREFPEVICT